MPAADVARIEASLSRLPVSRFDVPHGPLHRREIGSWWIYFALTREAGDAAILLVAVRPKDDPGLSVRDIMELAATIRGAFGV